MCVRGGFPRADRKKSDAPKLNWTRDVFTRLANHTDTHKATSVGHDLITHYQNYLAEYEDEHPEDVSVPDAGDDPVEFERCEPKQVGKLPEGAGGAGDGATGGRGRGGARRGPGRPRGSGRGARGGGRSRARVPRVKRRAASDFQVGCRVKVFWRAMDEWYSGVIEEQESSEGAEGAEGADAAEPVVLSKVVYDDGDVEVLDLVGGVEKVVLLTYVDGSATSDAELEPVFEPEGDSEGDDSDEDLPGGGRGGGRRSTRDPRISVSRRTLAKEENAPTRAPGGGPGARELRRRNPARAAAGAGGNANEGGEPDDARVRAVLERMKGNEAAKSLAELAADAEPPEEVFRVGYKMGARRAIACAAAVVAAAAARVGSNHVRSVTAVTAVSGDGVDPKERAKERTPELTATAAGGGDGGGAAAAAAAAVGVAASGARERRVRKKNSKYADDSDDDEDKSAKKAKKKKKDGDDVDDKAAGEKAADGKGTKQDAKQDTKKGSKSKSESPGVEDRALERSDALERELEDLRSEVAELRREKAIREEGERRGEKLARDAAKEGGAWDDPTASAAADPTLTRVLAALEEILAKEVFDPRVDDDDLDEAYDGEDELDLGAPCGDDDARGIDTDAVRAVLGVDASAERWRAERGYNPNALNNAAQTNRSFPPVPPGSAVLTAPPSAPPALPPLPVQSPADIVAAAYEEARQKRAAADDALANILDPVKLEQVQADAYNPKPTTTVGRLIKAANNAATRAERIAAGGGGDGRALRVAGIKRAGPGRPPGSTSRAKLVAKPAGTRPSQADMMERCGPGADDYEFRPPLGQSARAAAAKAFDAAKPEARDAKALDEKPKGRDGGEDGGLEKGVEKGGAVSWGDGDRVIDGDRALTGWLTKRGWGEYAAAFAAKGFTLAGLGSLTMQNLEDTVTDRADVREAIWGAIEAMRSREKDVGVRGRESARTPKSAKRPRTN